MFTYFETYGLWFSWYRFLSFSRFFLAFLTVSHSFPLVVSPYLSSSFVCSKRHQIKSYQHCTSRSIPWKSPETKKIIEKTKKRTDKKKQTSLVPFRKRGPSPRPLRIIVFLFLLFSPLRFFCCLEYFVDCVQFRILLHFQLFLALFAALADCILDAERQMTPWLTVHVAVNEKLRFNARMLSM